MTEKLSERVRNGEFIKRDSWYSYTNWPALADEIADLERRLEAADGVLLNLRTWLKTGAQITATDVNAEVLTVNTDGPHNMGINVYFPTNVYFTTQGGSPWTAGMKANPGGSTPSTE